MLVLAVLRMQHMPKNVERVFLEMGRATASEDLRSRASFGRITVKPRSYFFITDGWATIRPRSSIIASPHAFLVLRI